MQKHFHQPAGSIYRRGSGFAQRRGEHPWPAAVRQPRHQIAAEFFLGNEFSCLPVTVGVGAANRPVTSEANFIGARQRGVTQGGQPAIDRGMATGVLWFATVLITTAQGRASDPDWNALGQHNKINARIRRQITTNGILNCRDEFRQRDGFAFGIQRRILALNGQYVLMCRLDA